MTHEPDLKQSQSHLEQGNPHGPARINPDEQPRLVLASRSPRRQELLREAGYEFSIDPADVDEDDYPAEAAPIDLAIRLARIKSHAIAFKYPNDVILGADTIVAFGERIIGKPRDAAHAREILKLLSGTTHIVTTGVSVIRRATEYAEERRVMSAVRMRLLTSKDIDLYIESGQWQGKAGGYGIQDNDPFVQRMSGCHTNIVGLPMTTTKAMLAAAGIMPKK